MYMDFYCIVNISFLFINTPVLPQSLSLSSQRDIFSL